MSNKNLINGLAVLPQVCSHNYSPELIVVITLESLLFIGIGLWHFSCEEF